MGRIIVAGAGTDVGKTIVSAILTTLLGGDYWKPIGCGEDTDPATVKKWVDPKKHQIHSSSYTFKALGSPHHAARLENCSIDPGSILVPKTPRPLIIESVGGILVPLTMNFLSIDLFKQWGGKWVVISQHYIGSINHTLLTLDALQRRGIFISGIIFNGEPNPDSERAILEISKVPFLARLLPEANLNTQTIQKYAKQWHPYLRKLLH